jgi:hypothetical protein
MASELSNLQFSLNSLSKLREFNTEFYTKHMPRGLYLLASKNPILLKIGIPKMASGWSTVTVPEKEF